MASSNSRCWGIHKVLTLKRGVRGKRVLKYTMTGGKAIKTYDSFKMKYGSIYHLNPSFDE